MHASRFSVLAFAFLAVLPAPAAASDCGSPPIDRALNDSATGLILLYRGGTQPLSAPGKIEQWSFYDNEYLNGPVTPLLFEQTGTTAWAVVAIGTTRNSNASGVQMHPFGLLAGSAVLAPAKSYSVGFTHRSYTGSGASLQAGGAGGGVVDFTGYSDFSDKWSYASGTAQIGTVVGTGGLALDYAGLDGRIYSARFTFGDLVATPGCNASTALLSTNVASLAPGKSFNLSVSSPSIFGGIHKHFVGVANLSATGCGLFLPGLGELLLFPGTQTALGAGALNAGAGTLTLGVPQNPNLIGAKVIFQSVVVGTFSPFPAQLSIGLHAKITAN